MTSDAGVSEHLERIASIMAIQLVEDLETDEKRRTLAAIGYSAGEIATLLNEKVDTVQKFLKREREGTRPSSRKRTTGKPRAR